MDPIGKGVFVFFGDLGFLHPQPSIWGSMYGIFAYMWLISMVNVVKDISYTDPMLQINTPPEAEVFLLQPYDSCRMHGSDMFYL